MLTPVMIEDSCSDINFKKRNSDFAGMIEVVIGIVFVPIMLLTRQSFPDLPL